MKGYGCLEADHMRVVLWLASNVGLRMGVVLVLKLGCCESEALHDFTSQVIIRINLDIHLKRSDPRLPVEIKTKERLTR